MLGYEEARKIIEEHGAQRIVQAALKAYPNRRQELFDLVNKFGVEQTARMLLSDPSAQPRQPGMMSMPAPTTPVPAMPTATKAVSVQPAAKGLSTEERPVNPVGLGAVTPQSFETRPAKVPEGGVSVPSVSMPAVVPAEPATESIRP